MAISVIARVIAPFLGWDRLEGASSCIVVAHCGEPTPPTPNVMVVGGTKSDSEIQVISVLKGANNVASARLQTDHELRKGENYLVFGYYDDGIYKAYEEYKVVPLGAEFSTNWIAGKTLDEQIQILFRHAVGNLTREIQKDEEEKQRLEDGLKKLPST